MGRIYTAQFNGVSVTAQQDFFEVVAPADAVVIIREIEISQSSDVGDAAEEGLSILLKAGATVSGSGGSTPTAVPNELGDAAFGGTVEANNTTKANTGTIVTKRASVWNNRIPWLYHPEERDRIVISPSARFTVELATTPADALTCNGTITFEEIGG